MAEKYKLTYFNSKALAEPIRMMFAVAGVEYEDIRIQKEEWPEQKQNYDWGQLPVLEIGEKKLSQSNAIARYLGKQFKLAGSDDWEAAKLDELADVLVDFRTEWRKFFAEQDPEKKAESKKNLLEVAIPKYLGKLDVTKKDNGGKFLMGQNLTWVDIQFAHFLELFEITVGQAILDGYPNLKELQKNVFEVPTIKAWIEKRPVTAF